MGKALFWLCFIACSLTSVDLVKFGEFLRKPSSIQRKNEIRKEMMAYVKREFDDMMLTQIFLVLPPIFFLIFFLSTHLQLRSHTNFFSFTTKAVRFCHKN